MTHRTHLSLLGDSRASLGSQMVKNPPAMQETWLQPLGWQDPLEKGTATQSTILAWRIPWKEEPGRLQSMGSQRVEHDSVTFTFSLSGDSQVSSFPEPPTCLHPFPIHTLASTASPRKEEGYFTHTNFQQTRQLQQMVSPLPPIFLVTSGVWTLAKGNHIFSVHVTK